MLEKRKSLSRLIGHEEIAAGFFHYMHARGADELLIMSNAGAVQEQVVTLRRGPESREVGVADEDLRCAARIRAVFEIIDTPIEQECSAVGIEEDRRERVVGISFDE